MTMRRQENEMIMSTFVQMFEEEWIVNPAKAAGREGARQPSNEQLARARRRILDDGGRIYDAADRARALAWTPNSHVN
jgi:hypothetical protein